MVSQMFSSLPRHYRREQKTNEEQKKISHDLKALMKQINTMQKSIEIYFIVILVLMFFMTQKMLWSGSSKNLSLLTNLF